MAACNLGKTERLVRAGLSWMSMLAAPALGSPWALAGAGVLLTVVAAWCPLYALLGISTCRVRECLPADTARENDGFFVK